MPSIASSKDTMTTILSQRKVGPWKRDIKKTKGTDSNFMTCSSAGPGNKLDQVDELLLYSKQKDETVVLEHHDVPAEDLWILGKPHMCQDLSRFCTSDSLSHP